MPLTMSMNDFDFKSAGNRFLKGCGCLSISSFLLLIIIGIFVDDEETTNDNATKTEQVAKEEEKKDSVTLTRSSTV